MSTCFDAGLISLCIEYLGKAALSSVGTVSNLSSEASPCVLRRPEASPTFFASGH